MSDQAICKKPCDCFFVDKIGRTYFMELKMIDAYTLNLKKLEPQQVEFLSKISNLQSGPVMTYALVLVYSKKLKEWKILHWSEIEKNLLDDWSVQVFERLK